MRAIKLLPLLMLVTVVGMVVQGFVVLTLRQKAIGIAVMREQLQRGGLAQVTDVRGLPRACMDQGFLDGIYFVNAVDVAKIPDAFWASAAARRHWHRGPFADMSQESMLDEAARLGSIKGCPAVPAMNSSRFVVAFLYHESGELGPQTASSRGDGVMAYDTEKSRIYWVYSGN